MRLALDLPLAHFDSARHALRATRLSRPRPALHTDTGCASRVVLLTMPLLPVLFAALRIAVGHGLTDSLQNCAQTSLAVAF